MQCKLLPDPTTCQHSTPVPMPAVHSAHNVLYEACPASGLYMSRP